MKVKKEDIVKLRKISGQPIMDCKKALIETDSFDEAFEYLRINAKEKIDEKRKDRIASEGRVIIKGTNEYPVHNSRVAMTSLLCETDFTAKSDVFIKALDEITEILLKEESQIDSVDKIVESVKAQTGEKVELGQTYVVHVGDNMSIGTYVHFDNKKAALVQFETKTNPHQLQKLGQNIAMHIVAHKPQYLNQNEYALGPQKNIIFPKGIENKPLEIQEKIKIGVAKKHQKETVLLEQSYCLDENISVDQAIKDVRREVMMEITLKKFRHIEIGD